jgi:hypothetical protein
MHSEFGCARPLYEKNVHPRVLMGADEIARLRRCVRSGLGRRIFRIMRLKAAAMTQRILTSPDLPEAIGRWNVSWVEPFTNVMWGLLDTAVVGVLDEDARTTGAVWRVISNLPEALRRCPRGLERFGWGFPFGVAVAYDLICNEMPLKDRQSFNAWAAENLIRRMKAVVASRYYKNAGGNGTINYMETPLAMTLAIKGDPGAPPLDEDLRECLSFLEASLHVAIGPDGYPEEDIGYGTSVASSLSFLVEIVHRAGLYDAYSSCPRFARFGDAMLHFVQPWGGYLSNTGDHGDDFRSRELVLARLASETASPALLWLLGTLSYPTIGTRGPYEEDACGPEVPFAKGMNIPVSTSALLVLDELKEPVHPAKMGVPTHYRDRARGIVSFRSGWKADDTLVVFDGSQRSPGAQGHAHDSCGHFSLSALGEYFGIDTGRYNIEQNCHNVVLVDGKSGRSTDGQWRMSYYPGLLIDYEPGEFVDFAAVDSSHQHDCYWARRYLGLVKGTGAPAYVWTVEDINKDNAWHEFWWQLHTSPENEIETRPDSATVRGCGHGNMLDVHFALPAPHEYPQPHVLKEVTHDTATPSSYKYVGDPVEQAKKITRPPAMVHHAVYWRPRLLAKIAGLNGRFISVMIPRRKGERPAKVERLNCVPNVLAVRIRFPRVEDMLIFAYEHNLLEAGDVRGVGQWCVVRRSRKTGRVLAWQLGHGTGLSVSGKKPGTRREKTKPGRRASSY